MSDLLKQYKKAKKSNKGSIKAIVDNNSVFKEDESDDKELIEGKSSSLSTLSNNKVPTLMQTLGKYYSLLQYIKVNDFNKNVRRN